MAFELVLNLDNATYERASAFDIARILHQVAEKIWSEGLNQTDPQSVPVRDLLHGDHFCGSYRFVPEKRNERNEIAGVIINQYPLIALESKET